MFDLFGFLAGLFGRGGSGGAHNVPEFDGAGSLAAFALIVCAVAIVRARAR